MMILFKSTLSVRNQVSGTLQAKKRRNIKWLSLPRRMPLNKHPESSLLLLMTVLLGIHRLYTLRRKPQKTDRKRINQKQAFDSALSFVFNDLRGGQRSLSIPAASAVAFHDKPTSSIHESSSLGSSCDLSGYSILHHGTNSLSVASSIGTSRSATTCPPLPVTNVFLPRSGKGSRTSRRLQTQKKTAPGSLDKTHPALIRQLNLEPLPLDSFDMCLPVIETTDMGKNIQATTNRSLQSGEL